MSAPQVDFTPYFPPFTQVMPEGAFDGLISNYGIRFLYLRAHTCPCTQSGSTPGAAQASCLQCHGRGIYYDQPGLPFTGLATFMHTSSAPDEPGFHIDTKIGAVQRAEPTLTIPRNGNQYEAQVYAVSSEWDAYVELDAASRLSAVLKAGINEVLPYQQGIHVEDVTVYNAATNRAETLARSQYTVRGGVVSLNEPFQVGTPYTVEFSAMPTYIAFRGAGGMSHTRPFGLGVSGIPKRFRLVSLDLWTRATQSDNTGPNSPFYLSDKVPPVVAPTIPSAALEIQGWA